jgi:alpha-L-rhamnosidase
VLNAALAVIVGVLGLFRTGTDEPAAGRLTASELRCEYLVEPLAVHEAAPRLTWVLSSDRRGEVQRAYRILVASTPQKLAADEGDLWDSGKVDSRATAHVPYAGVKLTSRRVCWWKVRAWDRDERPGPWSTPSRWEMGLLDSADWTAAWIEAEPRGSGAVVTRAIYRANNGKAERDVTALVAETLARGQAVVASNEALGGDPARNVVKRLVVEYSVDGAPMRAEVAEGGTLPALGTRLPLLRRSFEIRKPVRSARLYATALGVYQLRLNGGRVGDAELAPGWTDYRTRVNYQAFDVTAQIVAGENVLGACVAPGWFAGRAGLFHARAFYGSTPSLRCQLEITYEDGSRDTISSDTMWMRQHGPTLAADIMDGEAYDARREIPGWDRPGFDASGWTPVSTRSEARSLQGSLDPPVRILEQRPALSVTEPAPGRWTFDVGENIVGVARLRISAPAGTVLTIRHGEVLNPDGTIYTANLRGAAATDTYVCRGGGVEEWQPCFTFHGFRYVEVTGLPSRPGPEAVTGIVLGTDVPKAGTFSCDNADVNRLQANIVRGMHGNYLSIPTDCPQRDERMGWMADTQVFVPTAAYNADIASFMTKWMLDVADSQRADGAHSDVAPVMKGLNFGTPAWADAGVIVPWTIYEMYGDARILERHIESMTRWVDWCRAHSTGLIRDRDRGNDYGDWLAIGADTPKDLIGTAYFARSTDLVARSLRVLGRDASVYEKLFSEIRAAFIARYVGPDGEVAGNTQCGYLLALRFGLLPDGLRPRALERLVADIESRGGRLSTGFVGVGLLLPTLADAGRADVAYRLLLQDAFPSWLFSVKHGATTIWERWDGWTPERGPHPDIGMNSFNHYSLGSCGQWLFSDMGGITPDPEHPGFERMIIRPRVDGPLTEASAGYRSIRGTISVAWKRAAGAMTLDVQVPANTTARLEIPARSLEAIRESGSRLDSVEGITSTEWKDGRARVILGSGTYRFAVLP